MSTTVKTGWLNDSNGDKFAPKTLISQVQTSDGILLEDKIQADLDIAKTEILESVTIPIDDTLSSVSTNPVQNKVIDAEFEAVGTAMNALELAIDGKADSSHIHSISDVTNLQTTLDSKVPTSRTINGKTLSSDITLSASDVGALPNTTTIPDALSDLTSDSTHRVVTDTEKAVWNAKSDFSGSYNDLTDKPSIPSISGLATETYVDETVSTKVDKVSGKGLSTNDYTTTEKNKLSGIASGAEVNQNAFSNVVIGSTTIAADTTTDTLTLVAGTNVTITPDATNDKITISATDTNTTYSAGTGISLNGTTFNNSGVRSISTGSTNGTISVNTNGTSANVAVKGLGSAAYTASTAYDAAGTAQTKADAALASAKEYTDSVKNDLLNGAGTAYDTLKELGDLIDENQDAIDALETVVSSKQDTITGAASTIASSNLTASRALVSNSSGKVAVSAVTSTELGYLDGVTSNIQTQLDNKPNTSDLGFVRIVNCTSSDGVAYTGTVDGVTSLTAGLTIVFVSSKTTTSKTPTLNINGLGAKNIKRRLSHLSTSTQEGYSTTWLFANKPFLLVYDGNQWIVDGLTKPSATDLYGIPAEATKATQDGSGNVITSTYATRSYVAEQIALAITTTLSTPV